MKYLITAAGLAALGAVSLNGAPEVSSPERTKPWSVSASLRGFYDDNPTTSPNSLKQESFGLEFNPSGSITLQNEQTLFRAGYGLGLKWFENRDDKTIDYSHSLDFLLRHTFSPRYKLEVSDSFVIAQEPEVLDSDGVITVPLRSEGDNLRNLGTIDFYAQMTELLGLVIGYSNTYYDYEADGFRSRSALLDRMQHLATINLRWQMQRQTVGVFGYQYGRVDYTSDEEIFFGIPADERNNSSHYLYLGADHQFNPKLNGSARVGAQFTDYYNAGEDQISPYVDVNLTWLYAPGSHLQGGVRHARNQTDVAIQDAANATTLDQESTTLYATWTHAITAKLTSNVLGQYQNSAFHNGLVDGDRDSYYMLGLNLNYKINRNWSAETGYNYDRLNSDIEGRTFTRNRLYIGVKVQY